MYAAVNLFKGQVAITCPSSLHAGKEGDWMGVTQLAAE